MGCMNHYCITNKILNFFVDAFLWCFCNRRFCFCGRSGYHTCVEMRSFRKEMSKTWVSDEDKNHFCNYQHDIYDIYLYIHMTVNKTKITTMMSPREDVSLSGQATESWMFNNRRPQMDMVSSPFIEESVLVTWFLPCLPCFYHVIP